MALPPGTHLGSYDTVRLVGAGGMGEVYEALDVRLDRRVAVKVLAGDVVSRPESRDRFRREARTISQLQHPHICTLYDIGTHEGHDYLVLEYIEGETLAARLERGPLPVADALGIARQIASALEAAHRRGIVHRDLKPANVMLTRAGTKRSGAPPTDDSAQVKLLDFGLAKEATVSAEIAAAATQTSPHGGQAPLTVEGRLVGTFQYMAPEQIEGGAIDGRTDLWALGCVIYEMVTGERPFHGRTAASVMSAVLKDEPPSVSMRQPLAPAALDQLVRTCLAKQPDGRFSTAHDFAIALSWVREASTASAVPAPRTGATSRRARVVAAAALGVVLAAAAGYLAGVRGSDRPPTRWLDHMPIDGDTFLGGPAVSPDGESLVFWARGQLWLRRLSEQEAVALPGTKGAEFPFWSPDGRAIGFGAAGQLLRLDLGASAPVPICPADTIRGGAWLGDDTVIFATMFSPLLRVPVTGGTPVALTTIDKGRGESSHRFPVALPDGRLLFQVYTDDTANIGIWVASIANPSNRSLVVNARSQGEYLDGHLFFVTADSLVAQPFDPPTGRLSGRPFNVAKAVGMSGVYHRYDFSLAANGTIVTRADRPLLRRLEVMNRKGDVLRRIGADGPINSVDISPAGSTVAVGRAGKIVLVNVDSAREAVPVDGPPAGETEPLWTSDGRQIAFAALAGPIGAANLFVAPAEGGAARPLVAPEGGQQRAAGWDASGAAVFFAVVPNGGLDIYRQPAGATRAEVFLATTNASEGPGRVSPDGRWLAYNTITTGSRSEVVIRSLTAKDQWTPVSIAGGSAPQWRNDSRELFFISPEGFLMAADVQTAPALVVGRPRQLFPVEIEDSLCAGYCYDVLPDGNTFVVSRLVERPLSWLRVATNWRPPMR